MTALTEDVGRGDLTTGLTVSPEANATMQVVARQELVVAGLDLIALTYDMLSDQLVVTNFVADGSIVPAGTKLAEVAGSAQPMLVGERVALNLLQRCCAVATLTWQYVKAVEGTGVEILDTRKTMPGLREIDKYAVFIGGGRNHRMRLDDGILIKDNHLALASSLKAAVEAARANGPVNMRIEVECDSLAQVEEALAAGAEILLLDNMDTEILRQATAMAKGRALTEASGGMNLERVREVAQTGVDFISVGALTHSALSVDIGLDFLPAT